MKLICPYCKKIIAESTEGIQNIKEVQCIYCDKFSTNPYFIREDLPSYVG
jgi:hypothetical protein